MKKPLTKAEEQVMQTLWKLGKGGLRDVTDAMPEPKPHANTVATILKILAEKDFVTIEPIGRVNLYWPKISKEEYSEQSMEYIAKAYFNGSFSNVISFLVENKNISINDLELLIKHLKNK
ncbi:MAG: BlaI/MecI/CopY family transcriptional regulator [Prevotellaceae bacterium]|jgi:predicted transcriptional regulator|nr:BlaI/MecI/CopY family transcriptional regulator [Prevotellaceae bacterium]